MNTLGSEADDSPGAILARLFEASGLFAQSEGIIDNLVDKLVDGPAGLLKIVRRPRLSTEQREQALRFILEHHGLTEIYPSDLRNLLTTVAKRRDKVSHSHVTVVPAGSLSLVGDNEETTTIVLNGAELIRWKAADVDEYLALATRLYGLLQTLQIELGVVGFAVFRGDPLTTFEPTGVEILGPRDADHVREPWTIERSSEVFSRFSTTS